MITDRYENRRAKREIDTKLYQMIATASLSDVKRLIDAGANPNAPVYNDINDDFYTIHRAALNSDINVLKYLVSIGVDPCRKDFWWRQPLAFAVRNNPLQFAKYLVEELGNKPDYEDMDGGTAIAEAALNPHIEVLDYVLDKGSDINAGAICTVPIEIALKHGTVERIAYLLDHGADISFASESVWCAPMANIRFLLERGFDPNSMDDWDKDRVIDHLDPKRRALFEEFGGTVLNPDAEKYYLMYQDEMPRDDI